MTYEESRSPDEPRGGAGMAREAAPFVLHRSDGFQLVVPKGATENVSSADDGRWQYREFLFRVSPEETAESTGVFYYWTRDPPAQLDLPRMRNLCRKVVEQHLFEGAFRLRMTTSVEGALGTSRSVVLKFRYSVNSPKIRGPMNLFTIHDPGRHWFFVLGIFTAQDGDLSREQEIIEMLEHKIVMSLQLGP